VRARKKFLSFELTSGGRAPYIGREHSTAVQTQTTAREGNRMPQRGDIVVERLTGKRAIVIHVNGEELTCRFADGRLEDRFAFELEPALPPLNSLLALLGSLFTSSSRPQSSQVGAGERPRPLLVRPSAS
jgi:hypothetical protein